LDREKLIVKQIPSGDLSFRFLLKFYTPDPNLLEDEYTRLVISENFDQSYTLVVHCDPRITSSLWLVCGSSYVNIECLQWSVERIVLLCLCSSVTVDVICISV
jgi:hypothetical protein